MYSTCEPMDPCSSYRGTTEVVRDSCVGFLPGLAPNGFACDSCLDSEATRHVTSPCAHTARALLSDNGKHIIVSAYRLVVFLSFLPSLQMLAGNFWDEIFCLQLFHWTTLKLPWKIWTNSCKSWNRIPEMSTVNARVSFRRSTVACQQKSRRTNPPTARSFSR